MRRLFIIFVLPLIFYYLVGASCIGKDTNEGDAMPPAKVNLLSHSKEDDALAPISLVNENLCGIDSESEIDAITVLWDIPLFNADGTPLDDLNGFYLYKSRLNDSLNVPYFDRSDSLIAVLSPLAHSFVDLDVEIGVRYYYNIIAYDDSNKKNQSIPSDTVDYKLIKKPMQIAPLHNTILDTLPIFMWDGVPGGDAAFYYYFVKVFNENDIIIWKSRPFFSQDEFVVAYADSQSLVLPEYKYNLPAGEYKWKVEAIKIDEDNTGSETPLNSFYIR